VLVERGKPTVATSPGQIILRLAWQIALLESDALQDLGAEASTDPLWFTTIPIVVNGDSLTILVLPALLVVATSQRICVEVRREDIPAGARRS
jgi:LysR family transcriptional regulator (chromosome initiation inhibitor)